MKFNRRSLNLISIILSISIVLFVSCGIKYIDNNLKTISEKRVVEKESKDDNLKKDNLEVKKNNEIDNDEEKTTKEEYDWYIEIPKIELYAKIEEGTSDEILNRSIGHFEETSRRIGNCGFAAHNRGYNVNYFSRLKELKKDDIVYYFVDGKKYKYKIDDSFIIYETDWSVS